MEKRQSEVTNKIRSAIKKKLAEIGDFSDELPEYIMILVANQRSKSQFEKDLSVFFGDDTVKFTDWLWDLLNNLNVCTKNSQPSVSKNEPVSIKKDSEADDDVVILDFDPDEHETDFLSQEDTNDSILSKSSVRPSSFQSNEIKEPVLAKPKQNYKYTEKNETNSLTKTRKSVLAPSSKETLPSAVISVKRKIACTEDEYDPTKPEYKKFSYGSSARRPGGPAALQANKLLQKAVDDAAKSILDGKKLEEFYKPTPIKVLTSKRIFNPPVSKNDNFQKKIVVHRILPEPKQFNISEISNLARTLEFNDDDVAEDNDYPPDVSMDDVSDGNFQAPQDDYSVSLNHIPLISDISELENLSYIDKNDCSYSYDALDEEPPKSPHFYVTLDGVTRTTFKRKFEEDSIDSVEEEEEDSEKEETSSPEEVVSSPEKKLKLNERCKYWPACKNSDQCSYHHPTVACKCFPDCKFGDKCLYIHPNCKFDALCSRKDCPFTHASKRKLPFIAVPVRMVPVKSPRMKAVCKFYPKCTSKNCPFIHPKLCRYGTDCRLPACLYSHFPVPSRSQMKWHATLS